MLTCQFAGKYRFLFRLLLLCILTFNSCSGSRHTFEALRGDLDSSPVFEHSFTGLAVYDPEAQKMLLDYNSEKYFTPASNIKLLTYYAAQRVLEDSITGLNYSVSGDSLIFSGTADPSFLNPDLPASEVYDFLKNAPQKLYYSPSSFPEERLGAGWAWDDYNYAFSAEKSAFPVYANQVNIKFVPGKEKPEIIPALFSDSLVLRQDSVNFLRVKRDLEKNIFYYSNPGKNKDFEQKIPFVTSPELVVKLLQDTLGREVELLPFKEQQRQYKNLSSIPADSIFRQMLIESDNLVAEQLLLQVADRLTDALSTSKGIVEVKQNFLGDLTGEPIWRDGSGLSRYNLISPKIMIEILEKLKNEVDDETLFQLLSQGGKTGTLKHQFLEEEPFIFAKTGSLSNNYSLSGYLQTKSGRLLIFSFMNSNYIVPTSILKAEMEKILRIIRNTY